MEDLARTEILEAMHARLEAAGVADSTGKKLTLRHRVAPVVIGRVGDDEPLFCTELTLAQTMPDKIFDGLGAIALLVQAQKVILVLHREAPKILSYVTQAAQATKIEVIAIPSLYPMDPISLICDLAQRPQKPSASLNLDQALVFNAVTLCDAAQALAGHYPLRRTLTVAGHVRKPGVMQAAIGTPIMEIVQTCGGSPDPDWIPFHNGVLGGSQVEQRTPVGADTRGIIILSHDHPLITRALTPLSALLRRAASACINCCLCTHRCPVHLSGGRLQPHLIMQNIATGWLGSEFLGHGSVLGALECIHCAVCTLSCPALLEPAHIIKAVADQLRLQGVTCAKEYALNPHPDRPGRRFSLQRVVERLGLSSYAKDPRLQQEA